MTNFAITRRTFVAAGALTAVGLAVAACGGKSGSGAGSSGGGSSSGVAKLRDIPDGGSLVVQSSPKGPLALDRTGDTVVCHSAKCTHMGCTVNAAGKQLHCPCHGSVYDAATGKVLHGPAPRALPSVAVKVENGEVRLA
jgi:cytochrome b6-f complex iron-sulfur subunit